MLMGYLRLARDTGALGQPADWRTVATHVCDLLALAIGATRDAAELAGKRGLSAARLQMLKDAVETNLSRLTLTVEALATAHGMTTRQVQRLFAQDGTTFTDFVLQERLALAHRLLRHPANAGRSIGSIALEAGFGDLSYFNRTFRRRYGCTPSDVRAGQD